MQNTIVGPIILLGAPNGSTWTGVTSGTSVPVAAGNHTEPSIFVIGNGAISGGTVLIEECALAQGQLDYTGTWSTMYTITASTLTGNAMQAFHFPPSAYRLRRVRISSTITGGGGISALLVDS